jgi:hypothetical protein
MRMTCGFGSITSLIIFVTGMVIFVTGMVSIGPSKFAGWPVWLEELLWGLPAAALNAVFAPKYAGLEAPKFVVDRTTMEEVQVSAEAYVILDTGALLDLHHPRIHLRRDDSGISPAVLIRQSQRWCR